MKKAGTTRHLPWILCGTVLAGIWAFQALERVWPRFDFFTRLEWMTFDWRVRLAARSQSVTATNLGFVAISDDSIDAVLNGTYELPYRFGLPWPRQVYGRLVNELAAQGAAAVGLDILFAELRPDHPALTRADGGTIPSDEFFAEEIRKAGNVVLAAENGLPPHLLFRAHALAVANISAQREADGILRRAKAYEDIFLWHPLIQAAARARGWNLQEARPGASQVAFPIAGGGEYALSLQGLNEFDQAGLYEQVTGLKSPESFPLPPIAFTRLRCWQMGIVLAAQALGLDLDAAEVELDKGRIVIPGRNGLARVIPVDGQGRFYVDWSMTPYHPALVRESIESLLAQYESRRAGRMEEVTNRWKDRLAVVGSTATGNNLTDLGATPLEKETYLLSTQWNVANAVLTGRFVHPPRLPVEWALALALGLLTTFLTWRLRVLWGTASVLALCALYVGIAAWAYVEWRWWIPIVLPAGGAMLTLHASLITGRVLTEQRERRRITDVFGRVVSPKVRDELIKAPELSLGGVRREITVVFADIRGFTSLAESSHAAAEEHVRRQGLTGAAAREYLEGRSQDMLEAVNLYLGLVADKVIKYDGTLDKYIGDCVMAFWNAPTPDERHAGSCVRAMIEAQLAICHLNGQRARQNQEQVTAPPGAEGAAAAAGSLPLLALGMGVSTGLTTVGLVGSEAHGFNYTVFGREVNLASRIEEIAGPGQILISEATYAVLRRDAPELAGQCVERQPVSLKGIRQPVPVYEVKWEQTPEVVAKAAQSGQQGD